MVIIVSTKRPFDYKLYRKHELLNRLNSLSGHFFNTFNFLSPYLLVYLVCNKLVEDTFYAK